MAHIIKDRVLETSTTTGTGDIALGGAVLGYLSFASAMVPGDTCWYLIQRVYRGVPQEDWEIGLGTWTGTGLSRDPRHSSNADALVDFPAGPKQVAMIVKAPDEVDSQTEWRNALGITPAGAPTITLTAGPAISGHRAVRVSGGVAVEADQSSLSDLNAVVGITLGAAGAGDPIQVQTAGLLTEPSWSWTPDLPVFLGTTGGLTQTPPSSGFTLIVGVAVTATQINIGLKVPIILA